jgi:hypothetical protein
MCTALLRNMHSPQLRTGTAYDASARPCGLQWAIAVGTCMLAAPQQKARQTTWKNSQLRKDLSHTRVSPEMTEVEGW